MKTFSTHWKASINRRKQRKYRYQAPLHIKQSFLGAHLSKDLRKKYGKRSITLKTGDKVKIMRGQFKKKTGTVERINLKRLKVYVTGIELYKKDGSKAFLPLEPSNLLITELKTDDKKRIQLLEKKPKQQEQPSTKQQSQPTEKKPHPHLKPKPQMKKQE